jgi:TPP-dependent 2-oxoacid decarboxylase
VFESMHKYVDSSDCLLLLGESITETNFSMTSTPINQSNCINVTGENRLVKYHKFEKIYLQDFVEDLIKSP